MSRRIKPLVLKNQTQAAPVVNSVDAVADPTRRDWLSVALWVLVAVGVGYLLLGGRGVTPAPGPDIDVQGLHVLMVTDNARPQSLTADQGTAVTSTKVRDYVIGKSGQLRKYDVKDDMSKESDTFQRLRELATNPPQMVALKNKRVTVQSIPAGVDATIQALEKLP